MSAHFPVLFFGALFCAASVNADDPISVENAPGKLLFSIGGEPFAAYHYEDVKRPFFANVYAPGKIKATRNFPPEKGDQTDHPHHQGIFLTFGDLNGIDYWHGTGKTVHAGFVKEPATAAGRMTFTVKNKYLSKDDKETLCSELGVCTIRSTKDGRVIEFDSVFTAEAVVRIGSKEEGGLAARMATPLAVMNGGRMIDNEGRVNGKEIWGQKAAWVDYSGKLGNRRVGITIMAHPLNPRPSYWHARDYGLFAANPFGPLGSKDGGMTLDKGASFRLRFAALVHSQEDGKPFDPAAAYKEYLVRE